MALPVSVRPVRGFARVSPTTFVTSIGRVRSDVWMLEGFDVAPSVWNRLTGAIRFRQR